MDKIIQRADQEYKRLRFHQAMILYKSIYEVEPDNYDACVGLALCLSGLKRYESAIQMAYKALALKPDSAVPHSVLAWSKYHQRRFSESEAEYRVALHIEPTSIPDLIMLAYVYTESGKKDEAEATLQEAIKVDPANPSVYKAKRAIYLTMREYQKAMTAARKAYSLKPSIRSAWAILDTLYRRYLRIFMVLLISVIVGAFLLTPPLATIALGVTTIMMLWGIIDVFMSGHRSASLVTLTLYVIYVIIMISRQPTI